MTSDILYSGIVYQTSMVLNSRYFMVSIVIRNLMLTNNSSFALCGDENLLPGNKSLRKKFRARCSVTSPFGLTHPPSCQTSSGFWTAGLPRRYFLHGPFLQGATEQAICKQDPKAKRCENRYMMTSQTYILQIC